MKWRFVAMLCGLWTGALFAFLFLAYGDPLRAVAFHIGFVLVFLPMMAFTLALGIETWRQTA